MVSDMKKVLERELWKCVSGGMDSAACERALAAEARRAAYARGANPEDPDWLSCRVSLDGAGGAKADVCVTDRDVINVLFRHEGQKIRTSSDAYGFIADKFSLLPWFSGMESTERVAFYIPEEVVADNTAAALSRLAVTSCVRACGLESWCAWEHRKTGGGYHIWRVNDLGNLGSISLERIIKAVNAHFVVCADAQGVSMDVPLTVSLAVGCPDKESTVVAAESVGAGDFLSAWPCRFGKAAIENVIYELEELDVGRGNGDHVRPIATLLSSYFLGEVPVSEEIVWFFWRVLDVCKHTGYSLYGILRDTLVALLSIADMHGQKLDFSKCRAGIRL